jgi:hypothetical protein
MTRGLKDIKSVIDEVKAAVEGAGILLMPMAFEPKLGIEARKKIVEADRLLNEAYTALNIIIPYLVEKT